MIQSPVTWIIHDTVTCMDNPSHVRRWRILQGFLIKLFLKRTPSTSRNLGNTTILRPGLLPPITRFSLIPLPISCSSSPVFDTLCFVVTRPRFSRSLGALVDSYRHLRAFSVSSPVSCPRYPGEFLCGFLRFLHSAVFPCPGLCPENVRSSASISSSLVFHCFSNSQRSAALFASPFLLSRWILDGGARAGSQRPQTEGSQLGRNSSRSTAKRPKLIRQDLPLSLSSPIASVPL